MKNDENVKNKKIGSRRLILAALSCSIAAVAATVAMLCYYFAPRRFEGRTVTVPDLIGVSEDSISLPDGFCIERDYVFSDDADTGSVIAQTPAPKSRKKLPVGQDVKIRITVSLGQMQGIIPDLCGVPYVTAAIRLRELGAVVVAVSMFDSGAEAGAVICTDPPANTRIRRGDKVTIYVARERISESVKVPLVVGMDSESAVTLLLARGLKLGEVGYIMSDEALWGRVITQSLRPDIYVDGGTIIDITLGYDPQQKDRALPIGEDIEG